MIYICYITGELEIAQKKYEEAKEEHEKTLAELQDM